jgi:transcription antitermination factor NusG
MSSVPQLWEPALAEPALASAVNEPHWYAVRTRAHHEKKATTQLEDRGITTFLPLIAQKHRWSDRNKTVQLPLFSCYTFVRIAVCREQRLITLQTPGVLGFVGIGGVAFPIPDKEIEDIQTLLAQNVTCALHPFVRVGQKVRIRGGCLDGVEGLLVAKNSDRSLVVSIELIQRSVAVRIDGYDVEPV